VNEWLLIPLTMIAFVFVAVVILVAIFGGWLAVRATVDRVTRSLPAGRLRRS
jgi:uncharacterized membrane protein (DUF485 family)